MSKLQSANLALLTPISDFSRHNTQALGGVSQLWQDFFSQALADQATPGSELATSSSALAATSSDGEPITGSQLLAHIISQRECAVQDTEVRPPEPLFLPIAEFDTELLPAPAVPFSSSEKITQQSTLAFDTTWRRPVVMSQGHEHPDPSQGPTPRPLYLPIAEFEWDLADKAAEPLDDATVTKQQAALEFDQRWARPVVLENLRTAA